MKKHLLHKYICSLLLSIFIIPCYGQTDRNMFRYGMRDKAGNLWFSRPGIGVYRYNPASDTFTGFTKEDGLNDNNVESILEDHAGNLWFSTEYGVCRYDGKSFTDLSKKEGMCKYDINCVLEDRNGNIWIGTNGWGVSRYNPATDAVTNFTKEQGLGSNAVQCLLEDKAGNLWCGERAGGVSRYDAALGKFTKIGDACFSDQIMDIKEDQAGNIWFANLYNGLCRYDGKNFTHLTEEDGLCNNIVKCIYEDKKGNLWFSCGDSKWDATAGFLCRYDPRLPEGKERFSARFTSKDGLTDSNIWTIAEDNDGNIWVGTRGGLYRYHSPSGRFIDYTFKVNSRN